MHQWPMTAGLFENSCSVHCMVHEIIIMCAVTLILSHLDLRSMQLVLLFYIAEPQMSVLTDTQQTSPSPQGASETQTSKWLP